MAWVFVFIAVGVAGFLLLIIIDYLNASSWLKPKAKIARQEILESEMQIESEQAVTDATKQEVEGLQQEVRDLEKKLTEIAKKVKEYREHERRRKPTKFKLKDEE